MIDLDWRVETALTGTCFRVGQIVRGTCTQCGDGPDVLLYDLDWDDPTLVCASCGRAAAVARKREPRQPCDECGAVGNVWRDPIGRKNRYLCVRHHDPEALFQNRWANKARESKPLRNVGLVCGAKGYGTDCKGELKWRTAYGMTLCNKHAGKTGVGPNG